MAIKWIPAAWKTQERAVKKYERVYLDFRQLIYPPVNENTPGILNEIVTVTDTATGVVV